MNNLPGIEFILEREEHWRLALESAERAVEYAKRQIHNCQAMKDLISGAATIVLLHGGEEG